MYNPIRFLDEYFVDHFLYKSKTLGNILGQYEELKPKVLEGIEGIEDDAYACTLRAEIRATCFQSIETLFELICSLLPRDGRIDNTDLWYQLSTSSWRKNYDFIKDVANGEDAFLEIEVVAGEKADGSPKEISFGHYLFYLGDHQEEIEKAIPESIAEIKESLQMLAREFQRREEYNALKHTMRLFPAVSGLFVKAKESEDWSPVADLEGSMSFLTKEKDESLVVHTAPMDTDRDLNLTQLASGLISNIIRTRRALFGQKEKGKEFQLLMLKEGATKVMGERSKPLHNLTFKITPIFDNDSE
jgi:hypothetical protein